jgi:hypothetical protein
LFHFIAFNPVAKEHIMMEAGTGIKPLSCKAEAEEKEEETKVPRFPANEYPKDLKTFHCALPLKVATTSQ